MGAKDTANPYRTKRRPNNVYATVFEKGRLVGIREVVESLPKGLFVADSPPEEGKPYSHLGCYILRWGKDSEPTVGLYRLSDSEEWQAKLKAWGIE